MNSLANIAAAIKQSNKHKDLIGFCVLHVILAIGVLIAVRTVAPSQRHIENSITPYGYTRSLILFVAPCVIFGTWLYNWIRSSSNRRKAFHTTLLLLTPLGVGLDIFLGRTFFTFENEKAVMQWTKLPGYDFQGGGLFGVFSGSNWKRAIPLEEMLFYGLGFTTILLTYLWADDVLFDQHRVEVKQKTPVLLSSWKATIVSSVVAACVAAAGAVIVSQTIGKENGCFPSYFLFLLFSATVPTIACFRLAFHFVNWRAMSVTWLFVLFISQFWEACLALPYQWWDYHHSQMMGIFVKPLCDLPLEALLVWSLATWTTIIVYETLLNRYRILKQDPSRSTKQILSGNEGDVTNLKHAYEKKRLARAYYDRAPLSCRPVLIATGILVLLLLVAAW